MIGFLTHPHHRFTQVFDWLFRWFPEPPQVHYGDPAGLAEFLAKVDDGAFDGVCLFQLDACLPYLASQTKVIACPMYDASRNRPSSYFPKGDNVFYINMCRKLHQSISAHGGKSMYFQYAPNPATLPKVNWEAPLQAHFWEREPGDLDCRTAEVLARRLGCEILDFRQFQDKRLTFEPGKSSGQTAGPWKSYEENLKRISASQVFIAPRRFEGIGMAFLEAMGMGCVVVAENQATANEYILHGSTGLLYAGDEEKICLFPPVQKSELPGIGNNSRNHIFRLHELSAETSSLITTEIEKFLSGAKKSSARREPELRNLCFETRGSTASFSSCPAKSPYSIYRNRKLAHEAEQRKNPWFRLKESLIRPKRKIRRVLQKNSARLDHWAKKLL